MKLLVAPCSFAAAKMAVERWHYSRCMPAGKLARFGVWENDKFIGAVLFGRGASPFAITRYGLTQYEGCELVRVALTDHVAPVSRIVAISIRMLRKESPGIRLLVSFADPDRGHHGGIYQAMGWTFTGETTPQNMYFDGSTYKHRRSVTTGGFNGPKWKLVRSVAGAERSKKVDYRKLPTKVVPAKYRYLLGLDEETKKLVASMAKPYPRAGKSSPEGPPLGEGGSIPTPALQEP